MATPQENTQDASDGNGQLEFKVGDQAQFKFIPDVSDDGLSWYDKSTAEIVEIDNNDPIAPYRIQILGYHNQADPFDSCWVSADELEAL